MYLLLIDQSLLSTTGKRHSHFSGDISPEPSASSFTPSTVVWLASCTKLVTMVAVLHCIERGLFCLDDYASDFLTEWKEPMILHGFDETGQPIMSKAENKISIYHLVTHTSGMGYESLSEELARYTNLKGESKKGTTGDIVSFS